MKVEKLKAVAGGAARRADPFIRPELAQSGQTMKQPEHDMAMKRLARRAAGLARNAAGVDAGLAPVSVVIPCYRCADTIVEAVASVAAQKLRPAEVLLIDDASGDGTLERLKAIARVCPDGWVKVLSMPRNGGASGARNLGWRHASQPWIAFLDADDTWHPSKLSVQMDVLANDPTICLLAHPMNVQRRSDPPPALRYPLKVKICPRHLMWPRSSFPTPSVVLRRDLPFRFDENRRRAEDFLLWAQILLSGYRCARLNQVLASLHKQPFGEGGLSGDLKAMREAGLDVRRALYAEGLIGPWQMRVLDVSNLLRYARRHVLTYARRVAARRRARHAPIETRARTSS
ncbi:glycosyltransferase family 2 protein [Rhodanobacter umsongensis]|uniref:Glycosyltransferase family 2 protein n=1 Tax=Rhodanobacter umsongensis TaxID=633153 RepID=A0ABW0JKN0_9GAMM